MPRWSVAKKEGPWKDRLMKQTVQLAGCGRTSAVDMCLCMEQRARGDLNGWPRAAYLTVDRSGVISVLKDTGNIRRTFVLWDRVIQFSMVFHDLPISGRWPVLSFRIWSFKSPEFNRRGRGKGLRYALLLTVATHFLDASVGFLPITTLLGPDAQWSTKDIGRLPRHPLGCRAPRPPTERAITT